MSGIFFKNCFTTILVFAAGSSAPPGAERRLRISEIKLAETKEENSNFSPQTHDRASPGQGAPSEARAQHACHEICKLAESGGDITNPDPAKLFEILEEWEAVLQAENIDFDQLSLSGLQPDEGLPR